MLSPYHIHLTRNTTTITTNTNVNTNTTNRNLHVFLSHMAWVLPSLYLIKIAENSDRKNSSSSSISDSDSSNIGNSIMTKASKGNWVWWVIGGYTLSVLAYNWSDIISQHFLSTTVDTSSNVHSYYDYDIIATIISGITYCITAPIWEEIFYRKIVFRFLSSLLPLSLSLPLSGLFFALHHDYSIDTILPLASLGCVWAYVYKVTGNLLVPTLIHMMMNITVFLSLNFNI